LTNPHLLTVRRLVNPCLTVVGQVFVSDSVYAASREEAVQEANAVRDSIGQAVSQAAGRGSRSGGAVNVVKKPIKPLLMTLASLQPRPSLHWPAPLDETMGRVDSLVNLVPALIPAVKRNALSGHGSIDSDSTCGSMAMPEVQDAQRIINADGSFGPIVQLISIDAGMALHAPADFDTGFVAVALAGVAKDTAPESQWYPLSSGYTRLNLAYGVNCVYLRHGGFATPNVVASQQRILAGASTVTQAGSTPPTPIDRAKTAIGATVAHPLLGPSSWTAVVAPAEHDTLCTTSSAPNAMTLDVVQFGDSPTDSIPKAARFVEGKDMMSFIAVKCANGWCVIGPNPKASLQPAAHAGAFSATAGPKPGRRTDDILWFDEQHLAVPDAAVTWKLVPGFLASIVPDTGLRNKNRSYKDKWYPMAYVYAPSKPPQKYQDGFGLRTGWNEIRMRQINGVWFAMVVSADGSTHVRDIQSMEHTFGDVPGTVRFDWVRTDDWVWVPCGDGCCLVQDGRDS
jgi:hypothetical protein